MLSQLIAATNGRFFSCVFVKADGTLRTMTCRTGVRKHLRGGVSTLNPDKYFTVYDVQAKGYRAINKDTIVALRMNGIECAVANMDSL